MFNFRHLPITSEPDSTANFEQLQTLFATIGKIEDPAEETKANTEAIIAILKAIRT